MTGKVDVTIADLRAVVADAPVIDLPRLLGALVEAEEQARLRLRAGSPMHDVGGTTQAGAVEADRLLTYAEAAKWLRVSESYVETLVRQGKLPAPTLPATAKGSGEHARDRAGRARRIWLSALKALVAKED